jgi:hypothetical protein
MTIGASTAQMRLLHVLARDAGEDHAHIRDRAATEFCIESLTELTDQQARHLIQLYQAILKPPVPVTAVARSSFFSLPKLVAKPAAAAPSKPVTPAPVALRSPPAPVKKPANNFDPSLKTQRGQGTRGLPVVKKKSFPGLPRYNVDAGAPFRPAVELTPLPYFRCPRYIALAELPAHWGGLEIRLLVFMIQKWNLNNVHGVSSIPIREAKRFLGAHRAQIEAAANNLVENPIITREVEDQLLVLFTPGRIGPRGKKFIGEFTPQGVWEESFTTLAGMRIKGEELLLQFSTTMISKLANPAALGYGKIQFEAISRIRSLAAVRLYILACVDVGMGGFEGKDRLWTPAMLARFMGYATEIRTDNLKRAVGRAIGEIKRAGAFNSDLTTAVYDRETSGRSHRTATIRFIWLGRRTVDPEMWGDEEAAAHQVITDRFQESVEQRVLARRLEDEREYKRLAAREAWEAAKARAVGMSDDDEMIEEAS